MTIQETVREFFTRYPQVAYTKGEHLLHAGEAVPHVFYITDGRVSQYDIAPNGNEVVVNVFKQGAFFPMSAAMNGTPNQYFFEASVDTTVRVAPVDEAVQFLKDNPDVLFDLLSRVYRGVDGVLRRMAHLMGGGAQSRLVFELLNAAQRFGEAQPDGSIIVRLKETDLGRHSGLARETVNRLMQQLKKDKLISVQKEGLVLHDVRALESQLGTAL